MLKKGDSYGEQKTNKNTIVDNDSIMCIGYRYEHTHYLYKE